MKTSNRILLYVLLGILGLLIMLAIVFRMHATPVSLSFLKGVDRLGSSQYTKTRTVISRGGQTIRKSYSFSNFNQVGISGKVDISIQRGNKSKVVVVADSNVFPFLEVYTEGDFLRIKTKKHVSLDNVEPIKVMITTPNIQEISVAGKIKIDARNIENNKLSLNVAGKSYCDLSGKVNKFDANLAGYSQINAKNLIANRIEINFAGKGELVVHANKQLIVNGLGRGIIQYYGNPEDVQNHVFGKLDMREVPLSNTKKK